jgi:hypothetical protein
VFFKGKQLTQLVQGRFPTGRQLQIKTATGLAPPSADGRHPGLPQADQIRIGHAEPSTAANEVALRRFAWTPREVSALGSVRPDLWAAADHRHAEAQSAEALKRRCFGFLFCGRSRCSQHRKMRVYVLYQPHQWKFPRWPPGST